MNICLNCSRETFTPFRPSRKKKYCDNKCQNEFEKKSGLRGDGKPKIISAEELHRLYISEGKSCLQIAKILNKSIRQISRYLSAYSIQTRPFSTKGLQTRKGAVLSDETKRKIATKHEGKTLTADHRKSISNSAPKGMNNHSWKGGITPINRKIRGSVEISLWRKSVFERDNFTCQMCGRRGGELEAHHIKSFAQYPEFRTSIENGRTLCKSCHRKTSTFGGKIRKPTK